MVLICTDRKEYHPGTDIIGDGGNWCQVLSSTGSMLQAPFRPLNLVCRQNHLLQKAIVQLPEPTVGARQPSITPVPGILLLFIGSCTPGTHKQTQVHTHMHT